MQSLPDEQDIMRFPKQYLINVIFTIVGNSFSQWVKQKIEERNQKIQVDKGLMMEGDDEINAYFQQSTAISQVIILLINLICY